MKKQILSILLFFSLASFAQFSVELETENLDVLEGEIRDVKINIHKSPKLKNEQFQVSLNACYPWVKLRKLSTLEYALTFSPNYISIIDSAFYTFEINFDVTSSSGVTEEKSMMVKIINVDQLPELAVNDSYGGDQFSFELSAFDPNGELSPVIELVGPALPGFFSLTDLDVVGDPYYPASRKLFSWNNIPQKLMGTTQRLEFRACTKEQLCSIKAVNLKLSN